jgi:hypothetical protein
MEGLRALLTGKIMDLDKSQQKELKAGRAQILKCAHCGKEVYYGSMNLLSLAIMKQKPACSYECNKALGQVE